jgi:membrane-associated phospholipid phosphatase
MKSAQWAAPVPRSAQSASMPMRFLCLAVMGVVFFSSYGLANWLASTRADVPTFAFAWESAIPFLPWSIVPYWSLDLLYAASFLLCATREDLRDHVKRLLVVQMISVACFIVWPLSFGIERPETSGIAGELFTLLMGFDKPYNQAPSLHIALAVVLWATYARHVRGVLSNALHVWFGAICVSVLTTWQHHFVDVPTGAAVGCLALFLFPLRDASSGGMPHASTRASVIACFYALAALVMFSTMLVCVRVSVAAALVTGWIALALACVGWIYWRGAPTAFGKDAHGAVAPGIALLLAPTIAGAFVNSRLWTRRRPAPVCIDERVSIGRTPRICELRAHGLDAVLDLTAEMPRWAALDGSFTYVCVPQLDLVTPAAQQFAEAVDALDRLHRMGHRVLVCCALGYGRSALCAAGWLAMHHDLRDARAALDHVRRVQPGAVWSDESVALLQSWIDARASRGQNA